MKISSNEEIRSGTENLKKCPICDCLNPDEEQFCRNCGGPLKYAEYVRKVPNEILQQQISTNKVQEATLQESEDKTKKDVDDRIHVPEDTGAASGEPLRKKQVRYKISRYSIIGFLLLLLVAGVFFIGKSANVQHLFDNGADNTDLPEKHSDQGEQTDSAMSEETVTESKASAAGQQEESVTEKGDDKAAKNAEDEYKWVKSAEIRAENGNIYNTEFIYDSNGNCVTENYYDHNNKLDYWREYGYDKQGNVLHERVFRARYDTDITSSVQTREIGYTYYNDGTMKSRHIACLDNGRAYYHEYDENGNEVKACSGLGGTEYDTITTYVNDEYGNPVHIITESDRYGEERHDESHAEYEYDTKGHMLKAVRYDTKGNVSEQQQYEYDKNGIILSKEEIKELGSGNTQKTVSVYKNGIKTKESQYANDVKEYYTDYIYDVSNRIVRETKYNASGEMVEDKQYKYKRIHL